MRASIVIDDAVRLDDKIVTVSFAIMQLVEKGKLLLNFSPCDVVDDDGGFRIVESSIDEVSEGFLRRGFVRVKCDDSEARRRRSRRLVVVVSVDRRRRRRGRNLLAS